MILITLIYILGIIMGLYLKSIILFLCFLIVTIAIIFIPIKKGKKYRTIAILLLMLSICSIKYKENKTNEAISHIKQYEEKDSISISGIVCSKITINKDKKVFIIKLNKIENKNVSRLNIKLKVKYKDLDVYSRR